MDSPSFTTLALGEILTPASVLMKMRGANRDAVLEELVDGVPALADRPEARALLLRALQDREQLCSTGIGDGIAFPHSRNALVGLVEKTVLVFGRHEAGVVYGSVDGQPARLFFLLVAPTVSQHLQVLARLGRLLRDPRLRQDLLKAPHADKICALVRDAEKALA